MTVDLSARHKVQPKYIPEPEAFYPVFCSLYERSHVYEDEVTEPWAPEGCARVGHVRGIDPPEGWVWHEQYPLCPSCEERWQKKFDIVKNITALMNGG